MAYFGAALMLLAIIYLTFGEPVDKPTQQSAAPV